MPSNRIGNVYDFLQVWRGRGGWDYSILVEDHPTKMFAAPYDRPPAFDLHVSHAEINADLGKDAWIISKYDSACRCYGFLRAWRMGAKFALTLDDDCYPEVNDGVWRLVRPLTVEHHEALFSHRKWVSSAGGRVRGMPYKNHGQVEGVVINVGLWTGNADYDAPQSLQKMDESRPERFLPPMVGSRLIPRHQYVPICGMNLFVKREAFPLMYFPLMGEGSPYRRFDDIWMGVIAKKVCDHLGWSVAVGEPYVRHVRASDPFKNLVKEAPGIVENETFWEVIDGIKLDSGADALECIWEIGMALLNGHKEGTYFNRLGDALVIWWGLFKEGAPS